MMASGRSRMLGLSAGVKHAATERIPYDANLKKQMLGIK
jgi:hypothetical protein